jgi:hypothetical protein
MQPILVIMIKPDLLDRGYRAIATFAGTSVGTAHNAVQNLIRQRELIQRSNGGYIFTDRARSIDQWVILYPSVLRPSLELGRYTASERNWMPEQPTSKEIEWQFGGETAAAVMTNYLRPATMTIYCERGIPKDMIKAGQLRADRAGNIEFVKAPIELQQFENQAPHIAHPLLVYADLLAIGDARNIETARILREKYLTL